MAPLDLLAPDELLALRRQPLTYAAVGATAGRMPDGYTTLSRTRTLGPSVEFAGAVERLMTWEVQRGAGIRVAASDPRVALDSVVVMHIGPGPLALRAPCRVVRVIDEPDRQGFAYGTLPGHPETGEESFVLRRRSDARIDFVITAFSRPATMVTRLGGPAGRAVQRLMTARYLRALDR